MPPWKADPRVGNWSNDPRLNDAEIAAIKAWVEGGEPEGNPKDLPPPVFADGWRAGKPDVVITIPKFTLDPKVPHEYAYFDVPTNFTEDR